MVASIIASLLLLALEISMQWDFIVRGEYRHYSLGQRAVVELLYFGVVCLWVSAIWPSLPPVS